MGLHEFSCNWGRRLLVPIVFPVYRKCPRHFMAGGWAAIRWVLRCLITAVPSHVCMDFTALLFFFTVDYVYRCNYKISPFSISTVVQRSSLSRPDKRLETSLLADCTLSSQFVLLKTTAHFGLPNMKLC